MKRDRINRATMRSPKVVAQYLRGDGLTPAEEALLSSVADETRGRAILDLGVGGGRTVPALVALSDDYVGLDLEPKMVAACRRRFPRQRFEVADARDLRRFADARFALVVFSCNGIGMVGHEGRLQILDEVRRVLQPGGVFAFSTHNRHSPDHDAPMQLPPFFPHVNPVKLAVRAARFAVELGRRINNRRRHVGAEFRGPDYSIINDRCHSYGTMLYYITLAEQRRQLDRAGFTFTAAYDLAGRIIDGDTTDSSITLLARKKGS